jgi:hypothetical protein
VGYPVVVDARAVHFFVVASGFYFHLPSGEHRVLCIGNPRLPVTSMTQCAAASAHGFAPTSLDGVAPSFVIAAPTGWADCRCLPLHVQSERRSICPPRSAYAVPSLRGLKVSILSKTPTKPGSPTPTHPAARTKHPAASGHEREGKSFGRARKGTISQLCRGL